MTSKGAERHLSRSPTGTVSARLGAQGAKALTNGLPHRSASVGKAEVAKMNLLAVHKIDPQVTKILQTVPKVVSYVFHEANNTWERTSVEGTLFVYSRASPPSHGLAILNRLSSDNLHELLFPGIEFRRQNPFVLFKRKSGQIHGLCFSEESQCQETGHLLNSLSTLMANGHFDAHSIALGMRSSSSPALKLETQHQQLPLGGHPKAEVLEMLESAGRGYLNQPFSDDASSQESLHSETISFTAPSTEHNHQHHKDVSRKQRSSSSRRSSEPVTGFQSKSKGKKNQEKEKRRTIAARSTSPKEANLPALPEQQNGSNRYRAVSPKQPQQSRKQFRNPLQQAASFDAVNSSQTRDSSRTKQGCNSSLPGSRSSSPFYEQSNLQKGLESARTPQGPTLASSPDLSSSSDMVSKKLFSPDPSSVTTYSTRSATVRATSPTPSTLRTLFSQASTGSTSTFIGSSSFPPPLKAISLAEVENQMKVEVPSPESVNPVSLFGSSAKSESGARITSEERQQLLLQPSAFTAVSLASLEQQALSGTHSSSASTVGPSISVSQSSSEISRETTPPPRLPAAILTAVQPVAISVQPPTPIVTESYPLSAPSGFITQVSSPQAFPAIPPLINSPGMRAAPLVNHKQQPVEEEKQMKAKGRPALVEQTPELVPVTSLHNLHLSTNVSTEPKLVEHSTPSDPAVLQSRETSSPAFDTQSFLSSSLDSGVGGGHPPHSALAASALMSPLQFRSKTSSGRIPADGITSLNREQFKLALLQLVQHDEDFVTSLHKAYQQMLSTPSGSQ